MISAAYAFDQKGEKMKKKFLVFFMALFALLCLAKTDVLNKPLNLYGTDSTALGNYLIDNSLVSVVVDNQSGFVTGAFLNENKVNIIDAIAPALKDESVVLSEIQPIQDGILLSFLSESFSIQTVLHLYGKSLFFSTEIKNISQKEKTLSYYDIIDFSNSSPDFYSTKLYDRYLLSVSQGSISLGFSTEGENISKRILINNRTGVVYAPVKKVLPGESMLLERTLRIEESLSSLQDYYGERYSIQRTKYAGKLKEGYGGIKIIAFNPLKQVVSLTRTFDDGSFCFMLQEGRYLFQAELGEQKSEICEPLENFTELKLGKIAPLDFVYYPFLTSRAQGEVTVNFRLNIPVPAYVLLYENGVLKEKSEPTPLSNFYHISFKNFVRGSNYSYEVIAQNPYENSILKSSMHELKNPADVLPSYSFVVYGDSQKYVNMHSRVVQRMYAENPALVIHCGDLVEKGDSPEDWVGFFKSIRPLGQKVPYFTVLGNHEYNTFNYYSSLALPKGGGNYQKRWYSFEYGDILFIMLDSNILTGDPNFSAQTSWLEEQLKSSQHKKYRFLVFHHPFWTTSQEYGPMKENLAAGHELTEFWLELFKKYNVQAVFNGHIHAYERYYKDGIMFITSGGSGGPLDTKHTAEKLSWNVTDVIGHWNYVLAEVSPQGVLFTVKGVAKSLKPLDENAFEEEDIILDRFFIQ